ncbi:MAG TPA: hypothetical protein ENG12_03780, partial [Candidatus Altiarchaeales archaeon]|nr:hypothetical protein [Candidatus Altiarchaeales archaeon]
MECRYNLNSSGNRRVIYFDCLDCKNQGSLRDKNCLRSVLRVLAEKGKADELQLRKREYTEFYDEDQMGKLLEIIELRKNLLGEEVWRGIEDCRRSHGDWKVFIRDLLAKEIWNPIRAYEILVAVLN